MYTHLDLNSKSYIYMYNYSAFIISWKFHIVIHTATGQGRSILGWGSTGRFCVMSTILKLDRILHHFEEIAHQITEYRHTMFVRFDMCAFSMNYDAESNLVYHESIHIWFHILFQKY